MSALRAQGYRFWPQHLLKGGSQPWGKIFSAGGSGAVLPVRVKKKKNNDKKMGFLIPMMLCCHNPQLLLLQWHQWPWVRQKAEKSVNNVIITQFLVQPCSATSLSFCLWHWSQRELAETKLTPVLFHSPCWVSLIYLFRLCPIFLPAGTESGIQRSPFRHFVHYCFSSHVFAFSP